MRLLLATRNQGKVQELTAMLADLPNIQVIGLRDVPPVPEVVEDGDAFEANACKKARQTSLATGLCTLADDSGLEVDALAGAPGVHSARYAGDDASDQQNNDKLLAALGGVPPEARTARFHAVLALALISQPERRGAAGAGPMPEIHTVGGTVEGHIAQAPAGTAGFGYDPLFIPRGHDRSMAQIPSDLKNTISHRGRALQKLRALLAHPLDERKA